MRPAVLLDVDGTLVDTSYFHAVAFFRAFRDIGEQVDIRRIHRGVGLDSTLLVRQLLGRDDERANEGHSRHFAPFRKEVVAFPGVAELFRELKRRELGVILVTSSKTDDLEAFLEVIPGLDAVDAVTKAADVAVAKPEPDIFEVALAENGIDRERAVVVGDSVWDVESAGRAGLPCIGLLAGGISECELKDAGAVAVYDDVADLLANIADSPIATL